MKRLHLEVSIHNFALICCKLCVLFFCHQLNAQPIHEYFYDNNLNATAGGPTLNETLACGATLGAFGTQTITTSSGFCTTANAFCFTQGGGLSYPNPNYITNNYSINLLFKFNNYGGWSRIIDFSNSTNDAGIYLLGNCLNFYPNGNVGTCPYFVPNIYYLFTFVRVSSTNIISVYVDGALFGTYNDAGNLYRPATNSTPINFFRDDNSVPCEAKAGCVKYTSITASALSPAQVDSLWTTICQVIVPLPIDLLSFAGTCNNQHTTLNWSTVIENHHDTYIIEKSSDAINWLAVGEIKDPENATSSKNYEYTDTLIQQGPFYYRLKQTDVEGKYKCSNIIWVDDCVGKSNQNLTIYPNPTESNIKMVLNSIADDKLTIYIFDTNGKIVQIEKDLPIKVGENQIEISQKLPAGFYTLKIIGAENDFIEKLVIK